MCLGQTLEDISGQTAAKPDSNRQGKLLFILGSTEGSSADHISFLKKDHSRISLEQARVVAKESVWKSWCSSPGEEMKSKPAWCWKGGRGFMYDLQGALTALKLHIKLSMCLYVFFWEECPYTLLFNNK